MLNSSQTVIIILVRIIIIEYIHYECYFFFCLLIKLQLKV